ncbi:MAG: hypothetical protein JST29_05635 [Bacteroidetes bacterium]|nr:hypothetical protein [Bacteroidota bacterium]
MQNINDFKIGTQFFWVDENGKPLMNKPDTVIEVDTIKGIIKGRVISAVHYKQCKLLVPVKNTYSQGWLDFLSK